MQKKASLTQNQNFKLKCFLPNSSSLELIAKSVTQFYLGKCYFHYNSSTFGILHYTESSSNMVRYEFIYYIYDCHCPFWGIAHPEQGNINLYDLRLLLWYRFVNSHGYMFLGFYQYIPAKKKVSYISVKIINPSAKRL